MSRISTFNQFSHRFHRSIYSTLLHQGSILLLIDDASLKDIQARILTNSQPMLLKEGNQNLITLDSATQHDVHSLVAPLPYPSNSPSAVKNGPHSQTVHLMQGIYRSTRKVCEKNNG